MLLPREFIEYLVRQLVQRLSPSVFEVTDPKVASDLIQSIVIEEMETEDRLNDEVREILSQYSEYMRREGVSYQEMFRRIKNKMLQERKVVRASGRDTGDAMKLSRDKVTDISHKIVSSMRKSRDFRLRKAHNDVRLEIVRTVTEILTGEETAGRTARAKVQSMKREITEGTEEYSLLHKRYYAEELKKLGIDFNA